MIKDKHGTEKIKKNNSKEIPKILLIFKKANKIKTYPKKVVSKYTEIEDFYINNRKILNNTFSQENRLSRELLSIFKSN